MHFTAYINEKYMVQSSLYNFQENFFQTGIPAYTL